MSRTRNVVFYQRPVDPPAVADPNSGVIAGALWMNTETAHLFGSHNDTDGSGDPIISWRREGNDTVDWANITNKPDIPDELTKQEFIDFLNQAAPLAQIPDVVAGVNDDRIGLTPQLLNQAVAVLTSAVRGGSLVTLAARPPANTAILFDRAAGLGSVTPEILQLRSVAVEAGDTLATRTLSFGPIDGQVLGWFVPIKYVYINGVRYHLGSVPGEASNRFTEGNLEVESDTAYKFAAIDSATRAQFPAGAFLAGDSFTVAFETEDGTLIPSGTTLSPASEFSRHLSNELSGRIGRNEEVLNDLVKVQDAPDSVDAGANAAATYQANFSYGLRYKRGVAKFDSDLIDHTSTISGGATISNPRTIRLNIQQTVDNGVYEIYIKKFAQAQDPIEVRGEADDGAGTLNVAYPLATTPGILRQEGGVVKVIIKRVGNTLNVSAVPFEVNTGPQGPQGIQGPQGDPGPQGPAGMGGGGTAAFEMEFIGLTVSLLTANDIPGGEITALVAIQGVANAPVGNFRAVVGGVNIPFTLALDTDRIYTIPLAITNVQHLNLRNNAGRNLNISIQFFKGTYDSHLIQIPLQPITLVTPERLQGQEYLESGRISFHTNTSNRITVSPLSLRGRSSDGLEVIAPVNIGVDFTTADIPGAIRTLATNAASARLAYNTSSSVRPTDSYLREEWTERSGDRDYYVDKVTFTLGGRVANAISDDPGGLAVGRIFPVLLANHDVTQVRECCDATILDIDRTANTIQVGLKRNAYTRGHANIEFENIKSPRRTLEGGITILVGGRVILNSNSLLSLLFDPTAAVPDGGIHVGDVAVLPTANEILFYRPRATEKAAPRVFKNTLKFEYVDNTTYRLQGDGVVSVNAVTKRFRQGLLVQANSTTLSFLFRETNAFYDVYWYAQEDSDDLRPSLVEPGKDETGAYVFEDGGDVCVLKTRVSKSGDLRQPDYAFTQDYNGYPYHRFNSEAKIPMTNSLKFTGAVGGSGTLVEASWQGEDFPEGATPTFTGIARQTTNTGGSWNGSSLRIDYATGFYRNRPVVTSTGVQNNDALTAQYEDDTGIGIFMFHVQTNNTRDFSTGNNQKLNILLKRTGDDARQVELDNFKG